MKIKEVPITIFSFILGIILIPLLLTISTFLFPFFRIPVGKKIKFQELKVQPKLIKIHFILRDLIENILGKELLFFANNIDDKKPYCLFISRKYLKKLPQEYWKWSSIDNMEQINQSVSIEVETRPLLFFGYLPAKLISFTIIDEKLEWSK